MPTSQLQVLSIDKIVLDKENPRIKQFLEIYTDNITSEQIAFALSGPGGSGESTTSYNVLKESIKVSEGIIHPIVVNKEESGVYVVIEGNTRLQIYKEFAESDINGPWKTITALVYSNLSDYEKHQIRLQSHLVGPRDWDPYSKAKYLHQLSEIEHMPMNSIISMCGGKTTEIQKAISAYISMQKFYRPYVEEKGYDFDTREYSKFVEFQNSKIQFAVQKKGYNEENFAEWVAEGNIDKAVMVRILPDVMKNEEALKTFLRKNISEANIIINSAKIDRNTDLTKIPYDLLCSQLSDVLDKLEYKEVKNLANEPLFESKRNKLEMLNDTLASLLEDIHEMEK